MSVRFRHPDGSLVHLAYCTNVHPAEDLDGVIGQLGRYARPARERLGVPLLGVGLWLARGVADVLVADPARLARLRAALDRHGLEVVTLNGFPYQGFQAEVVKHRVYHPDWTEPARLRYTLDLARILAGLLPDDVAEGSVSTLPLAWRHPWTEGQAATAARHRALLAEGLAELAAETGKTIRVGFEPEPGCVVETTAQAAAQGLGVCLDACHLAVAFEDPAAAVARLGPSIVKLQASAALHADRPADPATRRALASFAEPRFLHQTREAGHLHGTDDLDAALDGWLPGDAAWRVHFHVPLHAPPAPPLRSTGPVLEEVLAVLFGGDRALTRHIEVETYTWEVLPDPPRTPGALADGIAAELAWTRDRLIDLGLKEEHPA